MGFGGLEVGVEEVFLFPLFGERLRVFVMLVDLLYVTFWRRAGRVASRQRRTTLRDPGRAPSLVNYQCHVRCNRNVQFVIFYCSCVIINCVSFSARWYSY